MKRLIFTLVLATTAPLGFAAAQEPAAEAAHEKKGGKEAEGDEGGLEIWKWANFLVLAGGLGYLIGKNAGPFFAARSAGIRKDMEESLRQRQEAEARAAEVERRLAALGADIAALKAEEDRDMKAFTERLAQQTTEELARIQAHLGQEIESAGKTARLALKRYSADLAVGLAQQKIRSRITPAAQDGLVESFARDLR